MFSKKFILICSYWNPVHNSIKFNHQWITPKGYDTGIRVYNRVTKNNVPLIVKNKNYVKWYICGPTVYDSSHIGHASCYIRFDILNRILREFFHLNPVIALGVTDIDDKIILQSNKLNVEFKTLAKKHELEFFSQLNNLNILPPSFVLRVSDHIPEIIEFVSKIIHKGKGYTTKNGSVYFNKSSSVDVDFCKLNPPPRPNSMPLKEGQKSSLDFALWKKAKENEPYWDSPWGKGRPGWHIECSAMASKVFGSELDLHGGGIDLLFPHHENEEFQSCCYHNCDQWVNYWLHTGQLTIKEEKMSKSLGNFILISEFLKEYTPDHLRMLSFISPYRKALQYSQNAMELPVSSCKIFSRFLADSDSYVKGNWTKGNISESSLLQELSELNGKLKEYLMDDFDTGKCYFSLMQLAQNTLTRLNEERDETVSRSPGAVAAVSVFFKNFFNSLGFQLGSTASGFGLESVIPSSMMGQVPQNWPNLPTVDWLPPKAQEESDLQRLEFIVNQAVDFRCQVRNGALSCTEKPVKQSLLNACDSFRNELSTVGVKIKDTGKNSSSWSLLDMK